MEQREINIFESKKKQQRNMSGTLVTTSLKKIIDIPCMECCKNDTIMQKISSYLQICHNATCTRPYIVTGTVLLLNNHNCKQNRFYQNHRHMIDNMEGCMLAFLATEAMINTGRYQQLAISVQRIYSSECISNK
jgi:hypothetical protein